MNGSTWFEWVVIFLAAPVEFLAAVCIIIIVVAGGIYMLVRRLFFVALILILPGCATTAILRTLDPDDVAKMAETKDVHMCVRASGPPPTGGVTYVITPKDSKINIRFGPNCEILTVTNDTEIIVVPQDQSFRFNRVK